MAKIYTVYLDPGKCVSYTLPNNRKVFAGRPIKVKEEDLKIYQEAAVFSINEDVPRDEPKPKEKAAMAPDRAEVDAFNKEPEKKDDKKDSKKDTKKK